MIPVLRGEESLRRITEQAAGSGLMKPHEHQRVLNEFRREAAFTARDDPDRPKPTLASVMGPFAVAVVKKSKDG